MKKIVVTGHKGYIGSEIFFSLQMDGLSPIGIDLLEGKDVLKHMPKNDITIHCATTFTGNDVIEHNVNMTAKVLASTKHIIFLSSAAVYGNNKNALEDDILSPITPYGQAKEACEALIIKSNIPYTILRLSNVYSLRGGHGVIAHFLKGKNVIYGTENHIRDFVPVERIVQVMRSILAEFEYKWFNEICNVSSGKGITINALFKRLYPKKKPIYKEAKKEIQVSILNNEKLCVRV